MKIVMRAYKGCSTVVVTPTRENEPSMRTKFSGDDHSVRAGREADYWAQVGSNDYRRAVLERFTQKTLTYIV